MQECRQRQTQGICMFGRAGSAAGKHWQQHDRGQSQSLTSPCPPPLANIPTRQALLSFYLHKASLPWKRCFRGIFGTLPPKDPRARDARAATSILRAGPGCRQAHSSVLRGWG